MSKQARTLNQVNKAIQKEIGNVILEKGDGYFYVTSDDNSIGLHLSGLYSTSIYVCYLNHQTVDAWIEDVKNIVGNYPC